METKTSRADHLDTPKQAAHQAPNGL